jgi:pimeloyl-ACP methyl ester carboxylesterase
MPRTPLVLLHAYPVDSRMWDALRPGLDPLTPDQTGFGKAPLTKKAPSLDVVAADVLAVLDDHGLDRVVLGGCSMGGYAAMAVLRAAPERVAGLVLIDTRATADADEAAANRLAAAGRAEAEGIGWLADEMLPNLIAPTSRDRVGDGLRTLIDAQSPGAVAWAQRAMAERPDSTEALRGLGIPALVIHGAEDAIIPVSVGRELASTVDGEFAVLDGCGHLPPLEQPERVVELISDWLAHNDFA